jgi:hypothetical protein
MNMDDYPHFFLIEDGRLCSTGQHYPGLPRVLLSALIHLGYDKEALIHRCQSVIDSEHDTAIKMMAHAALTSLFESRLTATAALPIALLLIRNLENPVWQHHLEAVSDLEGSHFHAGMTSLAKYGQYLFNL